MTTIAATTLAPAILSALDAGPATADAPSSYEVPDTLVRVVAGGRSGCCG